MLQLRPEIGGDNAGVQTFSSHEDDIYMVFSFSQMRPPKKRNRIIGTQNECVPFPQNRSSHIFVAGSEYRSQLRHEKVLQSFPLPREADNPILTFVLPSMARILSGDLIDRVTGIFQGSHDPSAEGGGRSWAEVARPPTVQRQDRSRLESHTNTNVTSARAPAAGPGITAVSCEAEGTAYKRIRALTANLREFKAQIAQERQDNERTQAHERDESRVRLARKQEELEEIKVRLVHEQHQRADDGAKLRKVNVLLQGKHQEMKDLQADHDRLQAIVEDRNTARLLAGGINVQAAFPTLPEIEVSIRRALTVTVSEWIEEAPPAWSAAIWFPYMVSRVFLECRELVDGIMQKYTAFMQGGVQNDGGASAMDEFTVEGFRQHTRRHHRTLFPLTGEHLERACNEVAFNIGRWLQFFFPGSSVDVIAQDLMNAKVNRVVAEYLPILVGTRLQHPTVVFSEECGKMQRFDATVHAESIDGDAVSIGQRCLVVFPPLLVLREEGQGFQPLNKPYILPVAGC